MTSSHEGGGKGLRNDDITYRVKLMTRGGVKNLQKSGDVICGWSLTKERVDKDEVDDDDDVRGR